MEKKKGHPTEEQKERAAKAVRDSIAATDEIANAAQLRHLALVDLTLSVQPEYASARRDTDSENPVGRDLVFTFAGRQGTFERREGEDEAFVTFDWVVESRLRSSDKVVLSVRATYLVIVGGVRAFDGGAVASFIDGYSEFATYPFFRGLVSHLSGDAAADIPLLPIISLRRRAPRLRTVETAPGKPKGRRPKRLV